MLSAELPLRCLKERCELRLLQTMPIISRALVTQSETAVTIKSGLEAKISAKSLTLRSVPGIGIKSRNSGSRPMMSITMRFLS